MIKRVVVPLLSAVLALAVLPPRIVAAAVATTPMIAKTPTVPAGGTATFQVGVISPEKVPWAAASVTMTVEIFTVDGAFVAASAPVHPAADVQSNQIAFTFVDVRLPQHVSGAMTAGATIKHEGVIVGVSDIAGIAVGTVVAEAPRPGPGATFNGQLATNEIFAARSAQSGNVGFSGKYYGNRSFQTNVGLSSTPGAQQPVVTIQTLGSVTQVGTFSPSFDPLVFTGATGTGIGFKRVWSQNHSLSLATISGGHGSLNPYMLSALSYAIPLVGGTTLTATAGQEHVDGEVPLGVPSFMRSGTLAGLTLTHPSDLRGFSYALRYGVVNYDDAVSGKRRTDRALEGVLGFRVRRSTWSFDVVRAGPYFPNLSSPGVTPDRESESLQGSIPIGAIALNVGVTGSRDALPGSPSAQKAQLVSENIGASVPFRNGDALNLNLSNSAQHRDSIESIASGNDSTSISYSARRGPTTYALTVASANQRDSSGNLQHTIQNSLTVGRRFGPYLQLSGGVNLTGNHAAAMSGTSLLQAFVASATWTRGDISLSTALNRSNSLPFLGTAPVPNTALNYGFTFRPAKSRTSLSATMTQNHGGFSASTGSLNLARQF